MASQAAEGAAEPGPVRALEGGSQAGVGLSLAEGHEWAASVEAEAVAGSCYTLAEVGGTREAWLAGTWRVGVLVVALWVEGRRGRGAWVGRIQGAWAGRRARPSSSWTASSGSPRRTCMSWWWT